MPPSTKPEVHNVFHCRQTRSELPPPLTYTEYFVKLWRVVFEICERTDMHANRHTDTLIPIRRTPTGAKWKLTTTCWRIKIINTVYSSTAGCSGLQSCTKKCRDFLSRIINAWLHASRVQTAFALTFYELIYLRRRMSLENARRFLRHVICLLAGFLNKSSAVGLAEIGDRGHNSVGCHSST